MVKDRSEPWPAKNCIQVFDRLKELIVDVADQSVQCSQLQVLVNDMQEIWSTGPLELVPRSSRALFLSFYDAEDEARRRVNKIGPFQPGDK